MTDDDLFQEDTHVTKVTPFRKLRLLRGWSQEQMAERFHVNRRMIIDIEAGRRDCPKQLVRAMDREFGCGGKLIEYWLPRFSLAPVREYGVLERIWEWIKRRW